MKVCLVQPPYSSDFSKAPEYLKWELDTLDALDDSLDIVVLPENTDIPAFANTEQTYYAFENYSHVIIEKAKETAKRISAMVFFSADDFVDGMHLNTTYCVNREGEIVFKYYKQHPTPGEAKTRNITKGYAATYNTAPFVDMEGIRFAFLTCYDFYFYENCSQIARVKPDIIIGCSHQRTDRQDALQMMSKFYSYNCNAFVLRASVSMGEDSLLGGATMAVNPKGEVLLDMKSEVGVRTLEIDPHEKYLKPAGYKKPESSHADYIEAGRRPWKYRPAGPQVCLPDHMLPYPRVCAHRGYNTVCPENSLPAYGAAVALGAEEIEFDLWYTKDGQIVSTHDKKLERTSTGEGYVFDHTLAELQTYDFGIKKNERFKGLSVMTFEDVLKKFACQTIMNIHIKSVNNTDSLPEYYLKDIIALIEKYDCKKYVYFMTGNDTVLSQLRDLAPDIPRCVGGGDDPWGMVERAIKYDCTKIQLMKPKFNQEMIDKAHTNGIAVNVFWSDDPEETKRFLDMGIDCILTNDYLNIANTVKEYLSKQ